MRCRQPRCEHPRGWGSERGRGERVWFCIAVVVFSQWFMLWSSRPSQMFAWGSTTAPLTLFGTGGWVTLMEPCAGEVTLGLCAIPHSWTGKAMGSFALGWLLRGRWAHPQPTAGWAPVPIRTLPCLHRFEGSPFIIFFLRAWRFGELLIGTKRLNVPYVFPENTPRNRKC